MLAKLFVPCISIVLALINLIRPMQCDGPIVIRFVKKIPKYGIYPKKYMLHNLYY